MANINGSFGLRPLNKLGGGANSTGLTGYTQYEIASDNTGKLYHGQIVVPLRLKPLSMMTLVSCMSLRQTLRGQTRQRHAQVCF